MPEREELILAIVFLSAVASTFFLLPSPSNEFIRGVDKNGNGVWDDVEEKINAKYHWTGKGVEAFFHIAKALQSGVSEADMSQDRAIEIDAEVGFAMKCLASIDIDLTQEVTNLENWIVNNKKRTRSYMRYNLLLSGQVVHTPLRELCNFTK